MSALALHDGVDRVDPFKAAVDAIQVAAVAAASPDQFFELTLVGPELGSVKEREDFAERLKESAIVGACICHVEWTTPTQLTVTANIGPAHQECESAASCVISCELVKNGWNKFDAFGRQSPRIWYENGTFQVADGHGYGRTDGTMSGGYAFLVVMEVASVGQTKSSVLDKIAKILHCSTNGVLLVIMFNLKTDRQVDPPSHLFEAEVHLRGNGPHVDGKCPSSVLAPWENSSFTYRTPAPFEGLEIDIPGLYFGFEEQEHVQIHLNVTPVVEWTVAVMASELEKQLEREAAEAARGEVADDPELPPAALQHEAQDLDYEPSPSPTGSSQ